MRAGEVTLNHVGPGFLDELRQILPLLFIFAHDRSDQHLFGIILLELADCRQVFRQRVLGNLLHILKADKPGVFFGQMVEARRDFVGNEEADSFKHDPAPAAVIGLGAHVVTVAYW